MRFRSLEFGKLDKSHVAVGIGGAAVTGMALAAARALRAKAEEPWSALDIPETFPLTRKVLSKLQKGNLIVALSPRFELLLEIEDEKATSEGQRKVKVIKVRCMPSKCWDTTGMYRELVLTVGDKLTAFHNASLHFFKESHKMAFGNFPWEVYTADKSEEEWKQALGEDFQEQRAYWQEILDELKEAFPKADPVSVDAFEETWPEPPDTAVSDDERADTEEPSRTTLDLRDLDGTTPVDRAWMKDAIARFESGASRN